MCAACESGRMESAKVELFDDARENAFGHQSRKRESVSAWQAGLSDFEAMKQVGVTCPMRKDDTEPVHPVH